MSISLTKVPTKLNLGPEPKPDVDSIIAFLHRLVSTLQATYQQTATITNGLVGADVIANRPVSSPDSPIPLGGLYWSTDTSHLYVWTSSGWVQII